MKKYKYLYVDGYNVIGQRVKLSQLTHNELLEERRLLIEQLQNLSTTLADEVICVFDAYNVKSKESVKVTLGVTVVYTKEQQTADHYIEEQVGLKYNMHTTEVIVVTSDLSEQYSAFFQGAKRMSSREFNKLIQYEQKNISDIISAKKSKTPRSKIEISDEIYTKLDKLRRNITD